VGRAVVVYRANYSVARRLRARSSTDVSSLSSAASDTVILASTPKRWLIPQSNWRALVSSFSESRLIWRSRLSVFKCFWTMLAVLERRLWLVWGWSLSGFRVVLQSSLLDGVAFDPFSFQEDGPVSAEVDVGGRQVL
jgi:hypothetical protein